MCSSTPATSLVTSIIIAISDGETGGALVSSHYILNDLGKYDLPTPLVRLNFPSSIYYEDSQWQFRQHSIHFGVSGLPG